MKSALEVVVLAGVALMIVGANSGSGADAAEGLPRFEKGGEISEPQVREKTAPVYPEEARKQKIQGEVVLDAVVQEDGSVGPIEVVESDHDLLSEAAVAAVRKWRYEPARNADGEAVAVRYRVTIRFRLS